MPQNITSLQLINSGKIPSIDETKDAIFSIDSTKAPGKDDFQAKNFQHFWDLVKEDYYELITYFLKNHDFHPDLNKTLITLIPKTDNPLKVQNFRPLSLVNTTYKIITKILVA